MIICQRRGCSPLCAPQGSPCQSLDRAPGAAVRTLGGVAGAPPWAPRDRQVGESGAPELDGGGIWLQCIQPGARRVSPHSHLGQWCGAQRKGPVCVRLQKSLMPPLVNFTFISSHSHRRQEAGTLLYSSGL